MERIVSETIGAQLEPEDCDHAQESSSFFKDYLFDQRTGFFIEEIKKYKRESLDKDEELKELKASNRRLEDQLNQLQEITTTLAGQKGDSLKRIQNVNLLQTVADMTQETAKLNSRYEQVKGQLKEAVRQLKDFEQNLARRAIKTETKACQTVQHGVSQTETRTSSSVSEMEDSLMTELFYLPKDPELPDLRLFERI